jgi:hypothetical protein
MVMMVGCTKRHCFSFPCRPCSCLYECNMLFRRIRNSSATGIPHARVLRPEEISVLWGNHNTVMVVGTKRNTKKKNKVTLMSARSQTRNTQAKHATLNVEYVEYSTSTTPTPILKHVLWLPIVRCNTQPLSTTPTPILKHVLWLPIVRCMTKSFST